MQIKSISEAGSFGLRLPEKFSQTLVKQCVGLSAENAIKLEKALKKIPSEIIAIKNLYTTSRKTSLFGQRFNYIGIDYEQTMPTGKTVIKNYGYAYSGKKPFNANDIFQKVSELVNFVSGKKST